MSLLPPNSSALETALAFGTARIEGLPCAIDALWDAGRCPAAFLPWLAWAMSVEDWNPLWPENIQRQVVASSLQVHRYKGTPGAVRLALEALDFSDVELIEWYRQSPEGLPYTFTIDLAGMRDVQAEDWKTIRTAIWNAKNLRSHLGSIRLTRTHHSPVPTIAMALTTGQSAIIYPALSMSHTVQSPVFFGAAVYGAEIIQVMPKLTRKIAPHTARNRGVALHAVGIMTVYPIDN